VVNTSVIQQLAPHFLLFHAGAVSWGESGIVLPAAHGAGKTTLVAALAACGFGYFGDDIAAIEPESLRLLPYRKNACVKAGSRAALGSWYPQLAIEPPRVRFGGERVWYLPPPSGAWPSVAAPIRHIVLPQFVPGTRSRLEPITRVDALAVLRAQTFGETHTERSGATLERTVALLRAAQCHRLTIGHLGEAVALMVELASSA